MPKATVTQHCQGRSTVHDFIERTMIGHRKLPCTFWGLCSSGFPRQQSLTLVYWPLWVPCNLPSTYPISGWPWAPLLGCVRGKSPQGLFHLYRYDSRHSYITTPGTMNLLWSLLMAGDCEEPTSMLSPWKDDWELTPREYETIPCDPFEQGKEGKVSSSVEGKGFKRTLLWKRFQTR